MRRTVKNNIAGYVFLAPIILGLVIFTVLPFGLSFYYSFSKYNNLTPPEWIGLENYIKFFSDKTALNAFKVTFLFAIISVAVSMFLSFLLGLLMNVKIRGIKFFRVLIYTPVIIPGVASAAIWRDMFNPTHVGMINRILSVFGIEAQQWFSSQSTALGSLILVGLWGIGGGMLMWIAGFNSIDRSLYEAADLDGAGRIKKMTAITLPMMTPVIFYNLVMSVIVSLQAFGTAFLLTGGGPFESTNFIALNIYRVGIGLLNMGYASAQAWILFAVIITLTIVLFKTGGWVYYGDEKNK